MTPTTDAPAVVMIRPSTGWVALNFAELWAYRELLFFLVWRDVKVRYKQTALGAAWAILQPLLTHGRLHDLLRAPRRRRIRRPAVSDLFVRGPPAMDSLLAGRQPGVHEHREHGNARPESLFPTPDHPASGDRVGARRFRGRVRRAPRNDAVLRGAAVLEARLPPPLLLLAFAATTGIGLLLAALNVRYRDVRYIVPFCIQLWLFATPVIYPMSRVAEKLDALGIPLWVYGLNPMVGVVQGFRWSVLGAGTGLESVLVASIVVSCLLFVAGLVSFRRLERTFADVV